MDWGYPDKVIFEQLHAKDVNHRGVALLFCHGAVLMPLQVWDTRRTILMGVAI